MKILHLYKTYYPDSFGGVEQVIYQLAEGGKSVGIDAEVLFLSSHGRKRGVPFDHHLTHSSHQDLFIASTGFSWSAIQDFRELSHAADIIHYHFPWPYMDVLHFITRISKPSILTYHSDIIKQKYLLAFYRPLMHQFMRSVNKIVVTSPNYLSTSPYLSHYQHKISIIPIGLNRKSYPSALSERLLNWKKKLGNRFFLFVGALRYYKGLHILLDAMVGLDLPVVIAGAGPVEKELKIQAAKNQLKNIHFLGVISDEDKCALLELCYGVVFPSHLRSEAFGISLLEGAMYAKPMISSEIGTGTTYINIHERTGLVVPPSDPNALRAAMQRLWNEPEEARNYGFSAQQRYLELFTADKMIESYSHVYYDLMR